MARPFEHTAEEVCAACEGTGGIKIRVAKNLGCSRVTVDRYAKRYATVREALKQADEALTDIAENQAGALVNAGYWPAIKYRLDTKGRERGFGQQFDVNVKEVVELTVKYEEYDGNDEEATPDTV